MVARCAPPDQFFSFHRRAVPEPAQLGASARPDEVTQALSRIARLGGIGEDKFDAASTTRPCRTASSASGSRRSTNYGVDSTPTFFVNGKKVVGALPYDDSRRSSPQQRPARRGSSGDARAGRREHAGGGTARSTRAEQEVWWKRWYHTLMSYL